MKDGFRQSMAWLHTWCGLLPGWLLFVIFLFGSSAYFQQEISRWMRPELGGTQLSDAALDAAQAHLARNAAGAASWSLSLPNARGGDPLKASWTPREGSGQEAGEVSLDPATGRAIGLRDTKGGWFLYRFHFDLHYMPWYVARVVVSIAALAMLVALISGIVTHKKIFADFFMLRWGKRQRSWLDAHNVTAVVALPFHLMITYTGLVTLLFTLMPWAISANFPSQEAFYTAAYAPEPAKEPSGKPAPVAPLRTIVQEAERAWDGYRPNHVTITNPGDAASTVTLFPERTRLSAGPQALFLSGVTGKPLQPPVAAGGASKTQGVMIILHTGLYALPVLRWLYFLSGAAGAAMIATGLVLWTVKRRAKMLPDARPSFGFGLVERLNITVIAGAPGGIAVYFLANRLLPLGLEQRADWEINSLFIAWGAVLAWAIARPAKRAWIEALALCGALYAAVPMVSAATTDRGLLASLGAGDAVYVTFDLMMLALGAAFAYAARRVAIHRPRDISPRKNGARVSA